MRAAILSIGDELVLGESLDTNSAWLSMQLSQLGFLTVEHRTVGDTRPGISQAIRQLADQVDVMILTGGLGPTADDLTREGLGDAMDPGCDLVVDPEGVEHLRNWFENRGRVMPESNRSQTMRPVSAQLIPNPNGTAPGLKGKIKGCRVYALPGPPGEMKAMFRDSVQPEIPEDDSKYIQVTKTVCSFGVGEARAGEQLGDLLARDRDPLVGITASEAIITARVRSRGRREEVEPTIDDIIDRIREAWHPFAFGTSDDTLSKVVGRLLRKEKQTLATAESCTGGWLGQQIVNEAGSSSYYLGGWVTYTNAMKMECLDVSPELFEADGPGAVSCACAEAMARGAIRRSDADWSLAITGIAGPEGGAPCKPVGTVYIGLGWKSGDEIDVTIRRFEFTGHRQAIRHRSTQTALQLLRFALMGIRETEPLLWESPMSQEATGS